MVSADQLDILREHNDQRGRYQADLGEGLTAELTYYDQGGVRVIDHTVTPDAARGKGIACKLTAQAIADAAAENVKVHPACSYVAAWLRRHPEHNHLVAHDLAR